MSGDFKSIKRECENVSEILINKSRFLGFAKFVDNIKDAEEYVAALKNKYRDCRHIAFAYKLITTAKCSDDGEPAGTAGKPILELISQKGLHNVIVAVVRYFGGIKLGAGGLTRAYRTAANEALRDNTVVYQPVNIYTFNGSYAEFEALKSLHQKIVIKDIIYSDKVKATIICGEGERPQNCELVNRGFEYVPDK